MTLATLGGALFACCIAIAATMAIEKFGGALGGILGSAPTTIVPASLGFWFGASDVELFRDALFAVPVGMCVNAIFLYSWRWFPPRLQIGNVRYKLLAMTVISILIWGGCALLMVQGLELVLSVMFWVALLSTVGLLSFGVWACYGNPPAPKGSHAVSIGILLGRGLLAGVAIGVAIWIAELGIPVLAGMASVFPAIFVTTMVSVWLSQGEAVQAGAVGPMMLGSSSVAVYSFIAAFVIPLWNPIFGAIVSWGIAVCLISLPAWLWLRER